MNHTARSGTVSIICPCYNESDVIALFYDELREVLGSLDNLDYEIIFVDDGSSDETLDRLNTLAEQDGRVRICSLSRNFGHQVALTAGLDYARGDAAIMLDTDLQHPPQLIREMVEKWRSGYDIVSAVRRETASATWLKNVTSKGFYFILNKLSPTDVPEGVADFTLLSSRVYRELRDMRERNRFIRGMISWMGFKREFVYYDARDRAAGVSKYTFPKMLSMAADALLSFSSTPLRLATLVGIFITFLGFVYLAWIIARAILVGDLVVGWTSLIAVSLILGGCQLLFIGLIGQYLARVFDEVKGRPIYVLKQIPKGAAGEDAAADR
ncbi:MAG: glycosyltransferase family 2 protein [Candidatus Krumholzibacteria bacterium]|nr:glycosyltransferase family 2 protein [Candidatus Krumholzibacteria bacterium]